jgi:hypothetical protein
MGINRACGLNNLGRIMFNEDNIRLAFKYPSRLTECDLQELVKRMTKDASRRNANCRRTFRVGENYALVDVPKRDQRKSRKSKWMKRELTEVDKLQLQSAWGN